MKFLEAFNSSISPPPIWLMRQAGRYLPEYHCVRKKTADFMEICLTPETVVELTLQPIRRFSFDAAIIFSDILILAYALGQKVKFGPGVQLSKLPKEFTSIDNAYALLDPVFQAIRLVNAELTVPLIGFCGAPWTVASYMLAESKPEEKAESILSHPRLQETIDILTEFSISYLLGQIEAGARTLQIFDSWASLVPSHMREKLLFRPVRNIIKSIHHIHQKFPIIYYGRGISTCYTELLDCQVAFGVDESTDIHMLRSKLGESTVLQGNLSPQDLVLGNFEEKLKKTLDSQRGFRYIFNLGHGILPTTPIKHVEKLIDIIRSH